MERFGHALERGVIAPGNFTFLMLGGVTKPVPAEALAVFLAKLFAIDKGVLPALQILHMRMRGDRTDGREIDPRLAAVGRSFLADSRTYAKDHAREDHGIATIAKLVLAVDKGGETAVAICRALRTASESNRVRCRDFDELCGLLMTTHPRVVLDEIIGEPVGEDRIGRFFGGYVRNDDDVDQSKIKFDEAVALGWATENPGVRAVRLAEFIPYGKTMEDGSLSWSPLARQLIDLAPDPVAVLNTFERRFWSGSIIGSLSGRFVRRRPLVENLLEHPDVRIRSWARLASQRLEEDIRRWDAMDRRGESRFE